MITVTLNQIKSAEPCTDVWKKVLKANGGVNADYDKPFPLILILDSNDLDDTLWVISNVQELSKYDEIWRKLSSWCALQNIEKIAKYSSSEDYDLIVKWLETNDLDLRESAWSAARSAAWSVARSVARSADWSAAWSAAWSAVESAARSAAWSVARSAEFARYTARSADRSARSAQELKLRELLQ